jgi:nitrate reductase gamma subunit
MLWLQILVYISIGIFAILILAKVIKYSTMPLHLRWELYPVPHEKFKAEYGGSYYEEPEWWKKPRETSLAGELKEMLLEMIFIKRVFEYKRRLWYLTFPFHMGIYLMLIWFALLFLNAITSIAGFGVGDQLIVAIGGLGITLLSFGCVGLLLKRISDKSLRSYSTSVDYFNLLFILAVTVTGILAWTSDPNFTAAKASMMSLVTFSALPDLSPSQTIHMTLLSLLVAYIPTTKMTHFVAKYFTYHKILWEDTPNIVGSPLREKIKEVLSYKVSWSAPHIRQGITWAEEAMEIEPVMEVRAKLAEERKGK